MSPMPNQPDLDRHEIDRRFDYHSPDTEEKRLAHEQVRAMFKDMGTILTNLPDGREKALTMTKLEEASFWAHAAIARDGT